MKRAFALVFLLMLVAVSTFSQSVPQSVNFQGRLAKPDGTPVADNAAQTVTFRLYSALTGGTALWSQTGNVAVRNGAFAVALDFSTGFNGTNTLTSTFTASPYLEVQVGSDTPLMPRQPFRAVPYAFNASAANTVPNGSIGLNQLASSVLNFSNLTGTISNSQIAAGSITGDKIASGTLGIGALSASLQQTLGFISVVPGSPTLKSTTRTGSSPQSVAVSGSYAYVVNFSGSLQVFDVSNPASPSLKSTTTTGGNPPSVAVSGNYAYIVNNGSSSFQVFDVSTPASPILIGTATTGSGPQSVAVSGSTAYVVNNGSSTLQVFTLSTLVVNNNFQVRGSGLFIGDLSVAGNVTATSINLPNGASSIPLGLNEELGNTTGPIINLDLNFHQAGRNSSYVGGAMRIDGRSGTFPLFQFLSRPASSITETQIASIDQSGNAVFAGSVKANGVTLTSDARYKTNVATLNNALDDVLNLRGVSYDWNRAKWPEKGFSDSKQIGFIAQEIEKIFPELVFTDTNGYKSVNYIGVVPVLVEAVKTLNMKLDDKQKQIEALRSQVEALQTQVQENATLKARLDTLETLVRKLTEPGR